MNMESFKKEKTLFKVMGSSTGFLFVAILATFVGFSISSNLSLSDFYDSSIVGIIYEKIKIIFAFNLLLWPYFYCRQALLERRNVDPSNKFDDWAVTVGLQPSILLQLYSIAITLLILFQPQGIYPFGNWQAVFGGMLISLIPFFLLIVLSIWDLSRSGDNNEFRFVEKVLYPALATGIIPFSFGSSMAGKTFALTGIVIAVAYLVLLILINYFAKNEFTLVIPFLSFSLLLLIKEVWDVQILSSIVYGTLITSAMGVAEAAKRVYLAAEKDRFFIEEKPVEYYLGGSNWSSVVFPFLLVLVPLVVEDLPTWPLLIFVTIQSLSWTLLKREFKEKKIVLIYSYFTGFGLPILMIGSQILNWPATIIALDQPDLHTSVIFPTTLIITIGLAFFITIHKLGDEFRKFSKRILTYKNYIDGKYSYFLLIVVLIFIIGIVYVIAQFAPYSNDLIRQKAIEIILFADALMFALAIAFFTNYLRERGEKQENNIDSKEKENNLLSTLVFVLKTARPSTSLVAGLTTFMILIIGNHTPIWLAIILSLPIIIATMVGFIINDIYDFAHDRKSNLNRPIAQGLLARNDAFKIMIVLIIVALGISYFSIDDSLSFQVLTITISGVAIYSPLKHKYPAIKGVITSLLTLTPVIYASHIIGKDIPFFLYLSVFVFNIGRELLIDTEDYKRDLSAGLKTMVAYLGTRTSRITAWTVMFLGVLFLLFNLSNPKSIIFASLGLLSLILGLILELRFNLKHDLMTKITMVFCILGFPFAF